MNLPESEKLNIASLSRLFDNKSECYKLFWFQAILTYVCKGQQEITFEELIDEMIADAWYILDAGCGTGRDSLVFINAGYAVDAFDASEGMCRYASDLLKIKVKCMQFEELSGENEYDGIWACASLLHVNAVDLPDVLTRIKKLLKPDGVFYASFKSGSGERVKEGRYFNDMTTETCRKLFSESGFRILELFESEDVRPGRSEDWVNVIAGTGKEVKQKTKC